MSHFAPSRMRGRRPLAIALLAVGSLLVAACGGDESGGGGSNGGDNEPAGDPVPGGELVYGLEAETADGWCLAEAQLAISGIQVARTIYDTLTAPNEDGEYEPFLAESVEPNETYDEWTITLREGVKFHDGTDLDATVVKNNLDAYRGTYPARNPLLFRFVLQDIADVQVADPMTVKVMTTRPWPAFPATLFASGRLGMMAQAQLDSDNCAREMIGTGPFELENWTTGESLSATKNPDYWGTDADGNQLPYLDRIEYQPYPDGGARVNALLGGSVNMIHTASAQQILQLREDAESGNVNLVESDEYAEVSYGMMNTSAPPFDSLTARKAVAYAVDQETFNQVVNEGLLQIASGPFAPGSMGYVEDAGLPRYDLDEAKKLVAQYEQESGQPLKFTLQHTTDAEVTAAAQLLQEQARKAGMQVDLKAVEQATLIETVIGTEWQIATFRNHPGGDPDTQYYWWHSSQPTNFGKFKDDEVDALLDEGRESSDPERRKEIYQELNKRLGEQVYNYWLNWTMWAVASDSNIHGVMGPELPSGKGPFPGLATGHPVTAIWIEQ